MPPRSANAVWASVSSRSPKPLHCRSRSGRPNTPWGHPEDGPHVPVAGELCIQRAEELASLGELR